MGVPVSGVYYNRASSLVSGGDAGQRAGAGGVSIGRCGWVEPDGLVLNERVSAQGLLGLVAIQYGDWRRVFWDDDSLAWKIREGSNITLISRAPGVWVQFASGASYNARVYTDPLDGSLIAGYAVGLELTPWAVGVPCGPGGLSLITTWNTGT